LALGEATFDATESWPEIVGEDLKGFAVRFDAGEELKGFAVTFDAGEDLKGFAVTFIVGLSKDFVTGFGLRSA